MLLATFQRYICTEDFIIKLFLFLITNYIFYFDQQIMTNVINVTISNTYHSFLCVYKKIQQIQDTKFSPTLVNNVYTTMKYNRVMSIKRQQRHE